MGRASLENGKELGQWTEFNAKLNLIKKKKIIIRFSERRKKIY